MSKIILLSGGFDPLHVGHIAMIHQAARYDARVYIALNSDAWLVAKKGYRFMPWGIGGSTKPQSSSWLVNEAIEQMRQLND